MPFEIVHADITNMEVDAIVNSANSKILVGDGVDAAIYNKAGSELLLAREALGEIAPREARITAGFNLKARYIIHSVAPKWIDGKSCEVDLLTICYQKALTCAMAHKIKTIAFPLLGAGNNGFSKELTLKIAVNAISSFVLKHDIHVYLVVYDKKAFYFSSKLFVAVKCFISKHFAPNVEAKASQISFLNKNYIDGRRERIGAASLDTELDLGLAPTDEINSDCCIDDDKIAYNDMVLSSPLSNKDVKEEKSQPTEPLDLASISKMLTMLDASFSDTLLYLIRASGKKESEVYKKANVDRRLFSKIKSNEHYKPSKNTALAFALALELNLDATKDLIARAGFALSHSSKFDLIVEYFISHHNFNIFELNEVLFAFDQPLIGGS